MEHNIDNEIMLKINNISNRQYMLSPCVKSGDDRECTNKDFYQEAPDPIDIGKLGYGIRVAHKKTNIPYTIVNFEKGKVTKANLQKKINSTLQLMYNAASNYMLRLLNHYEDENNIFLIFEGFNGETLENKILRGMITKEEIFLIFFCVCKAVLHLHKHKMTNISVLPESILVDQDGYAKLTDYNLKMSARNKKPPRATKYLKIGTGQFVVNSYTSPEEITSLRNRTRPQISPKTDSWNVGILLYEMLTGFRCPFKSSTIDEMAEHILRCQIDLNAIEDSFCKELIRRLVRARPDDRLDIEEVVKMEQFAQYEDLDEGGIDMSECIINLPVNTHQKTQSNEEVSTHEYDRSMMESLKFENENLKKKIEQLQMKMSTSNSFATNSYGDESTEIKTKMTNSSRKTRISKSIINDEISSFDEIIKAEENKLLTEKDLELKEKYLDEKLKQLNQSDADFEEENEKSDTYSEGGEEKERVYWRAKYKKLKKKYEALQSENKENINKLKKTNEIISKLQKEKFELEEKIKLGIIEKVDSANSSDVNSNLTMAIEAFTESQTSFKEVVDKLISMANEQHESLMKENESYINEKQKKFFDVMKRIKSQNIEDDKEINLRQSYKEQINEQQRKIEELLDYKLKYQQKESVENGYLEKINMLSESEKITEEQNKNLQILLDQKSDEQKKNKKRIMSLELRLSNAKNFVGKHFDGILVEEFFKEIEEKEEDIKE